MFKCYIIVCAPVSVKLVCAQFLRLGAAKSRSVPPTLATMNGMHLSTFDLAFYGVIQVVFKTISQHTNQQFEGFGKSDFTIINCYWAQISILVFVLLNLPIPESSQRLYWPRLSTSPWQEILSTWSHANHLAVSNHLFWQELQSIVQLLFIINKLFTP